MHKNRDQQSLYTMKNKLPVHTAVLMDAAGLVILSVQRGALEAMKGGAFSLPNLPLAVAILLVCVTAELYSRRISVGGQLLFFVTASVFLACSFYLPPVGLSSDMYAVLGYTVIILQLSIMLAVVFLKRADFLRIIIGSLVIGFVLSTAAFAYTFSFDPSASTNRKYDAAVVLGAEVLPDHKPSPLLQGRLDAALRLYKAGLIKKIAVTGAGQSHAEARYLLSNGVPDSSIITEDHTFCTCEQADFIKTVLADSLNMKRIVIATDSWHLPRALMMCRWQGVKADGVASKFKMTLSETVDYRIHEAAGLEVYVLFGA